MFDILMDIGKSVLGEIIGGSGKGGSGGGQMYDPAAAKMGFAAERQTAMTASRDAINLTSSRNKNAQENRTEQQIKRQREVADLIKNIKDTNVREAIIAQAERQGLIDHSSILTSKLKTAVTTDTDTKIKPQSIGTA
tara:strand:+ start:2693 stop:3103 length:411 start_codon:yes stop_codon:yes gene_type:complete